MLRAVHLPIRIGLVAGSLYNALRFAIGENQAPSRNSQLQPGSMAPNRIGHERVHSHTHAFPAMEPFEALRPGLAGSAARTAADLCPIRPRIHRFRRPRTGPDRSRAAGSAGRRRRHPGAVVTTPSLLPRRRPFPERGSSPPRSPPRRWGCSSRSWLHARPNRRASARSQLQCLSPSAALAPPAADGSFSIGALTSQPHAARARHVDAARSLVALPGVGAGRRHRDRA